MADKPIKEDEQEREQRHIPCSADEDEIRGKAIPINEIKPNKPWPKPPTDNKGSGSDD